MTDSSRPRIDPVGRRFGVVEISRGGWCNTLPIGNLGEGQLLGSLLGQIRATWTARVTIPMCCVMEKDHPRGQSRPRSMS
jgi:hypothetical protein